MDPIENLMASLATGVFLQAFRNIDERGFAFCKRIVHLEHKV
jgi:hypothetical protein